MIEHLQSWIDEPANFLWITIILQVVLLFGLYFSQFNFRDLSKILDKANNNGAEMIKLNKSIHENETNAVNECKRLLHSNWELKRKVERYESIYGPLSAES